MHNLFNASEKYVIIYSSNIDEKTHKTETHVKHRIFTDWVEKNKPNWKRLKHIPNLYPLKKTVNEGTPSDFYIYKKFN